MNSKHHAVVEIGSDEIVFRVDTRWLRFTQDEMVGSGGKEAMFELREDGAVRIGDVTDEMDMAAERVAREMLAER